MRTITSRPTTTGFALMLTACVMQPAAAVQPTRLLWEAQGVENVVCITAIPDIDNDLVPDVIFESYDAGPSGVDHLFAISGRSSSVGTVIWSARPLGGPSNSGGYGDYCLHIVPDLNGDGHSDLLFGAAWGSRTAFGLDGLAGSTLWSFDTYADTPPAPPQSGWIYDMSPLGSDLTGDGVTEVLFCAGSDNHCVYCADGATGGILWFYRGQDAFDFVDSIADVNNDGVRDVIAAETDNYPGVFAFSGAGGPGGTASILWSKNLSNAVWSCCEIPLAAPQAATIVIGCWDENIRGYDAATGALRWTGNVGDPVQRVVRIQDVNDDGIDDVGVGSWDNAGRVHSGASGGLIWRTPVGTLNGGDCWAVDPVGDTNGDGHEDLAVGSFDHKAYLMDGVSGAILWSYNLGDRVLTIRGVPDLTGNRIADVVAGTQMLTGQTHGGVCFAFEGNDAFPPASVGEGAETDRFALRAQPNPSSDAVHWSFRLERPAARALFEIYDPAGRLVRVLLDGPAGGGLATTFWDGRDEAGRTMPAGIYLGRLYVDGRVNASGRAVRIQ